MKSCVAEMSLKKRIKIEPEWGNGVKVAHSKQIYTEALSEKNRTYSGSHYLSKIMQKGTD